MDELGGVDEGQYVVLYLPRPPHDLVSAPTFLDPILFTDSSIHISSY